MTHAVFFPRDGHAIRHPRGETPRQTRLAWLRARFTVDAATLFALIERTGSEEQAGRISRQQFRG